VTQSANGSVSANNIPNNDEYSDWAKNSRSTIIIDYSKTMLSSSSGAVAVYFAIMKYVGLDAVNNLSLSHYGVLPPIMFLLAVICFALAIQPHIAVLTVIDFTAFRDKRLQSIYGYNMAGTILFIVGIAIALFIFFALGL